MNILKMVKFIRSDIKSSYGFDKAPQSIKEKICNGVGPAIWPPEIRDAVDSIAGLGLSLTDASDPHDWGYIMAPNTPEGKERIDKEFGDNLIRIVFRETPLYNLPLLFARLATTKTCYLVVVEYGQEAFEAAQKKKKSLQEDLINHGIVYK